MRERRARRFGRRRGDRALLIGASLVIFVGVAIYTQSCDSNGPSKPDPVVVSIPSPQQTSPAAVTPQPAGGDPDGGGGPGPTSVDCNAAGICTFTTTIPHHVHAACTQPLQTNDWGSWNAVIKTGDTVSVYDICDAVKIGIDLCEGGETKVQVDFFAGAGEFIGAWGLTPGHKLVYAPNEQYCECEPGEWEIVKKGEPEEGDVVDCGLTEIDPPSLITQAPCFECFEITTDVTESNGCEQRESVITEIDQREVECQCEETWVEEQEPEVVVGEWGECVLGERSRTVTSIWYEVNSCTEERRESRRTEETETEECAVPGLCYYKISGVPEVIKEFICEQPQGFPFFGGGGHWINFTGSKLDNHCEIQVPGISQNNFNLTPGQSDPNCLRKQDD